MMKMTLLDKVIEYLDELDFSGAYKHGAPGGEYNYEAKLICNRISRDNSVEEIALIMADIFSETFWCFAKAERFMEIAQMIKNNLFAEEHN